MRLLSTVVHRLLLIVTLLYGLSVGLLASLWHSEIRYRWWLELPNIFAPYLFLPLLLLIPLAMLLPSRFFSWHRSRYRHRLCNRVWPVARTIGNKCAARR